MEQKEITKNLNIQDYDFIVDNNNITRAKVTYSFGKGQSIYYKDGLREKENYIDEISLELSGLDNQDNEVWISFMLKISLEDLNKYTDIPEDISNYIIKSESFIKRPSDEYATFLELNFKTNTKEDIYKNLSSFWISKLDTNIFIFKVCVPNEVFAYFKVDFN